MSFGEEENLYSKEFRQYMEFALRQFLIEKHGFTESQSSMKVAQEYETVLRMAKKEGYL